MREDDEEILAAQLIKQKEKAMLEAYKAKLFKNVLGTPQGKK
jgi:hypothetical protein